ncbi:hypothetical protein [uncultured Duncaniella sp.]|uniref:hypothetical protein n=1 Tax=uncultured Duncaniella sp. TaxID=2768039 RepID=UPI0025EB09F8|nr:hypothetical protein [uncultured Duncaniella sp.]
MKKFLASLLVGAASLGIAVNAADHCAMCPSPAPAPFTSSLGIFNHLGLGVGVGTNGISVEAATPITRFISLRAGVHFMPNITFNTDVDADFTTTINGVPTQMSESVDVEGALGRTQGSVIFNIYPFPHGSFFIAAGGYFGGNKLITIKGHSAALENMDDASIEVGDYKIPVDKNGNVRGGLKVKSFRPYLGIGWGRAIPKRLLNFNFELGAQFQGKPQVYSETGDLEDLAYEADNDFKDYIKYLKVYPTLTFRLTGKIF